MPTEKPRYTVIVDEELLKRIDDFRFENRYPSRSAATLELIRLGMEALEKQQKEELEQLRQEAKKKAANQTMLAAFGGDNKIHESDDDELERIRKIKEEDNQ